MADLENSKWPPQKNLAFQLRQFSIFFDEKAFRHKLKNSLKTHITHFLPVFELMSESLATIQVETNQCPSHQSILLTQGPIHENFIKKY
jgi:hypothetical protein